MGSLSKQLTQNPPKPPDFVGGVTPEIPHDYLAVTRVLRITALSDLSITAEITQGSKFFRLLDVMAEPWFYGPTSDPPDPITHKKVVEWQTDDSPPTLQWDGATPVKVSSGEALQVFVGSLVPGPEGTNPPGPFSGQLVINNNNTTFMTLALSGSYRGVNLNSFIGQKWQALGGEAVLGGVLANEGPSDDGQGRAQSFQNGVLYQYQFLLGPRTPPITFVFFLTAALYSKWYDLRQMTDANGGSVYNDVGWPSNDAFYTADGGHGILMQSGVIVTRLSGNTFVVYGAIYKHYQSFGDISDPAQQPFLGLPVSDELPATQTRGRVSRFDNGDVYWTPTTGAFEIHGAIRDHWQLLGDPLADYLGFPTSDEHGTADGIGRFSNFEKGAIYWTPTTGAHAIRGSILEYWKALGGEHSYLGYPTSDEIINGAFTSQIFQSGEISLTGTNPPYDIPLYHEFNPIVWTTPSGSALGGSVALTLFSNGNFSARFQTQDTGLIGYSYNVSAVFTIGALAAPGLFPNGFSAAINHGGSLSGSLDTSGSPNDDFTVNGNWPTLTGAAYVAATAIGKIWESHAYNTNDFVGAFEQAAQGLLSIVTTAEGELLAFTYVLAAEAGQVFDALGVKLGPGFIFAAAADLIAALVPWQLGIGIPDLESIVMCTTPAIALGLDAVIRQKHIDPETYQKINVAVFSSKLPPYETIWLTDLQGAGGRAFTFPGVDGKYYVNIGSGYDSPESYMMPDGYQKYQLLVHELTHVWQFAYSLHVLINSDFPLCNAIATQVDSSVGGSGYNVYLYGPPDVAWGDFNLEQQASIVEHWFAGVAVQDAPDRPNGPNGTGKGGWIDLDSIDLNSIPQDLPPTAQKDPYYHYIADLAGTANT